MFQGILNRVILAFLIAGHLQAQVINIEGKRFLRDSNGFTGRLEFNYNINQNVQRISVLGMNIHAQYKYNKHRVLAISELLSVSSDNLDFVNSGYQHLRYNYKVAGILTWEAFVQGQYNRVLKLDERYMAGTGPRLRLVKNKHLRAYTAFLYLYEVQSQNNDSIKSKNNRLSNYISFTIDYDRIDFTNTFFYQPNIAAFNDYRIAGDSSFEVEINRVLNFRTGFNFLYDTRQPPGVPAFTFILKNGIVFKL